MDEDIFRSAIENTAKKYVKDNTKVKVYKTIPEDKYNSYTLQLDYGNYHTFHILNNMYANRESHIMRVVSDLCINLSRMTGEERNFFFKRSDE